MEKEFYKALEDQFRGSRDSIKQRLGNYNFIVSGLKQRKNLKALIDIGCGRGEWLEFLKSNGLDCIGIDQDTAMIEFCKKSGLNAVQQNAVDYLKSIPDGSVSMVSSFHVIEHMSFDELSVFIKEVLRVLEPSGIVLLETPNPQNLHVSTCTFHLDPTHTKPIPEPFLKFLLTYIGFKSVHSLNVNHPPELLNSDRITLVNVLTNVSPDYAVIGINGDNADSAFHFEFEQTNFKTSLFGLSNRYQDYMETRIETRIETQIETRIGTQLNPLDLRVQELNLQVQHLQNLVLKLKNNWLVNGVYRILKKII